MTFEALEVMEGAVRRASVIGLGNIFKGDFGAGCYVVDALWQEPLGDSVDLSYLAEDSFCAGAYVYGAEYAVIVQAIDMGAPYGSISCWDKNTFFSNLGWFSEASLLNKSLTHALVRADLSDGLPDDLLFIWIEPKKTAGLGISAEIRKTLRKTVNIVKDNLHQRGFLSEAVRGLSLIYQMKVLRTAI